MRINVKGTRPGKAPRPLAEKKTHGRGAEQEKAATRKQKQLRRRATAARRRQRTLCQRMYPRLDPASLRAILGDDDTDDW
jgi:hypothetical protein